MSFTKKEYTSGQTTISADNLNAIQDELVQLDGYVQIVESKVVNFNNFKWYYRTFSDGITEIFGKIDDLTLTSGYTLIPLPINFEETISCNVNPWYGSSTNRFPKTTITTVAGLYNTDGNLLTIYDRDASSNQGTGKRSYYVHLIGYKKK